MKKKLLKQLKPWRFDIIRFKPFVYVIIVVNISIDCRTLYENEIKALEKAIESFVVDIESSIQAHLGYLSIWARHSYMKLVHNKRTTSAHYIRRGWPLG